MPNGRIKIGSSFLKIGSKYVRIGPAANEICDDFESGLGAWTFTDFGNSTHDLGAINTPVSPVNNLQIHIHNNAAIDSVQFYRNINPGDLVSDIIQLQFWMFPGEAASWDIIFDDGNGHEYKFYPFGGPTHLWVSSNPSDVDTGLLSFDASGFNQFTLKMNRATGEYVSAEFTGNGGQFADLSGVPYSGVAGGAVIQPSFRLFSPGAAGPDHELYETDFDNICVGDA